MEALQRHKRRLLYGGGGLLTALIAVLAASGIAAQCKEFTVEQMEVFQTGQAAISQALSQGNRGAIAITNISDAIWIDQQDRLLADGRPLLQPFLAQHGELTLSAGASRSLPWLVLQRPGGSMPEDTLAKYLGAANQHSLLAAWTTLFSNDRTPFVYAYDPTRSIFLISGLDSEKDLLRVMGADSRAQALDRLVSLDQQHRTEAAFATTYGGRISYALAPNPVTGQPALFTSVSLQSNGHEYLRRVFFQGLSKITDPLGQATRDSFRVMTRDGVTVFDSGETSSSLDNHAVADFFKRRPAALTANGITLWRGMGVPVVASLMPETDWILLHPYSSEDVWHGLVPQLFGIALAALLSLAGLWILLLRIDRRALTPALAEASRVYESEALNRTIIETSPVGLCLIDANEGALILGNRRIEEVSGRSEFSLSDPLYAGLVEHLREAAHEKSEHMWQMEAPWANGQVHLLEVTSTPVHYLEKAVWLCAFRDITAQREFEDSLEQARSDAEKARVLAESASKSKSAFVAGMSHEIRTPLYGILGHLELLSQSQLAPGQKERLVRIRQSADVLLNTISDVLDFSKIEAGQLDVVHEPFVLRQLVENCALLFAPQAHRKGLALYVHMDPSLGESYVSDAHRIGQILNNLLSNAVKFTAFGRIHLHVFPRHTDDADGASWLCFQVVDSGIGLTQQQQVQLFEPFFQADSSISRQHGGTGLGLTLCRQLAQLLGGGVSVWSEPGVGSEFTLQLPLVEGRRKPYEPAERRLDGVVVILLADAPPWQAEFHAFLLSKGARVVSAHELLELAIDEGEGRAVWLMVGAANDVPSEREAADSSANRAIVRATIDGPLVPERRGDEWVVSCYISDAVVKAIREAVGLPTVVSETSPSMNSPRHGAKVLLVEDHVVNRELIRQQLESLGFVVYEAENGEQALDAWRRGKYDILLTDLNMPGMNGYELTRAVRKEDRDIPILAISASALSSEKERCRSVGVTDFLLKPISLTQLDDAMRRYIPLHRLRVDVPVSVRSSASPSEKVRKAFFGRGLEDLAAMRAAREQGDLAALKDVVHAFKGALLMMKEFDVAARCSTLEATLHEGLPLRWEEDVDPLFPLLDAVIARYRD